MKCSQLGAAGGLSSLPTQLGTSRVTVPFPFAVASRQILCAKLNLFVLMKRKASDPDAGGEGSERGSASSFVAFQCSKCLVWKSGSSFKWSHGGWCVECVHQHFRQQEAERNRRSQESGK